MRDYNYTIEDMLKITDRGNEIFISYNKKKYIIYWKPDKKDFLNINYFMEKLFKKNLKGKYCIALIKGKVVDEIQRFNTIEELYRNTIIEGNKLIDIWSKIKIEDILGNKLSDLN